MTALVAYGGICFTIAIATDFLVRTSTMAGSLVWICVAVLPVYLVAVWLAHRRPDHPQTRRLLLLAATFATGALSPTSIPDRIRTAGCSGSMSPRPR